MFKNISLSGLFLILVFYTNTAPAKEFCTYIFSAQRPSSHVTKAMHSYSREWDYLPSDPGSIEHIFPEFSFFVKKLSHIAQHYPLHKESPSLTALSIHMLALQIKETWQQSHIYLSALSKHETQHHNLQKHSLLMVDLIKARTYKFLHLFEEAAHLIERESDNPHEQWKQFKNFLEYRTQYTSWLSEVLVRLKTPGAAHPYYSLERQIDVVFKNGRAWGEVKSIHRTTHHDDNNFAGLKKQLSAQIAYKNELNKTLPPDKQVQEIHIFFMFPITKQARQDLEQIGVIVHAPLHHWSPSESQFLESFHGKII